MLIYHWCLSFVVCYGIREVRNETICQEVTAGQAERKENNKMLEERKEQEIKNMVSILEQIDLQGILLLTRDANTLLMRQKEIEWEQKVG